MEPGTVALLAVLIVLVAFLYSSVGHAGASGYLAAMALLSVTPEVMRPTALALNVLVATVASVQFARAGHFRWRLFWPFAVTSIPAAFIGGSVVLPEHVYKPAIGVVLLVSAWRLVAAARRVDDGVRPPPVPLALAVGAVIGLAAGLTGTGGGIFLSPVILLCGWADPKKTGAVSAVFILVNSLAGLAGLVSTVGALPAALPIWAAAALVGGVAGSYLGSRRLRTPTLRRLLAAVLVIAGLKLVLAW